MLHQGRLLTLFLLVGKFVYINKFSQFVSLIEGNILEHRRRVNKYDHVIHFPDKEYKYFYAVDLYIVDMIYVLGCDPEKYKGMSSKLLNLLQDILGDEYLVHHYHECSRKDIILKTHEILQLFIKNEKPYRTIKKGTVVQYNGLIFPLNNDIICVDKSKFPSDLSSNEDIYYCKDLLMCDRNKLFYNSDDKLFESSIIPKSPSTFNVYVYTLRYGFDICELPYDDDYRFSVYKVNECYVKGIVNKLPPRASMFNSLSKYTYDTVLQTYN